VSLTVTASLTLALGIGANAAISARCAESRSPLTNRDEDRLIYIARAHRVCTPTRPSVPEIDDPRPA
jgi:hypothetical protein